MTDDDQKKTQCIDKQNTVLVNLLHKQLFYFLQGSFNNIMLQKMPIKTQIRLCNLIFEQRCQICFVEACEHIRR